MVSGSQLFQHSDEDWEWNDITELLVELGNNDDQPAEVQAQPFVTYDLFVTRGWGPGAEHWQLAKRYSDFAELNAQVKLESGVSLELPPKKMFGNKDRELIKQRREAFQMFLRQLCGHPVLQHSAALKRFLDPRRYADNPTDEYFKSAHIFIRNAAEWQMGDRLHGIGACAQQPCLACLSDDRSLPAGGVRGW